MNLFDRDPYSKTFGYADRLYWGWKVSDFSNGTMQGAVLSLATGLKLSEKYRKNKNIVLDVIRSGILACEHIMAKNGSMVEAYPGENSFCVTALVAHDILRTLRILGDDLEEEFHKKAISIVEPMIDFITKNDEEHAIISNHLATGLAAIELWNACTEEKNTRANELLEIIASHQSDEGWFKEYEGPDPGYQTLCTYYLASAKEAGNSLSSLDMDGSLEFLSKFVHPDGSIGGFYGSRNTKVLYPGGLEYFKNQNETCINDALALIYNGFAAKNHLLPQNIDIGNYIPLINSYAFAALHFSDSIQNSKDAQQFEIKLKEAGIYAIKNSCYHAIINYKKGGCLCVYNNVSKELDYEDSGYFGRLSNGKIFSSQQYQVQGEFNDKKIQSSFFLVNQNSPGPLSTIILRMLSLTFLKSVSFGNWFKKRIVKMLMTGKKKIDGSVLRTIHFNEENIEVIDKINRPRKALSIELGHSSRAIHMASSGYFMDKGIPPSHIVKHSIS